MSFALGHIEDTFPNKVSYSYLLSRKINCGANSLQGDVGGLHKGHDVKFCGQSKHSTKGLITDVGSVLVVKQKGMRGNHKHLFHTLIK